MYESESDVVDVSGKETKDVTLTKECDDVEEIVWGLEATTHEIVYDLWEEVENQEEFKGFGWHGYPEGDITVNATYSPSWHDVVEYIAERDGVDNPAGIYLSLRSNNRTGDSGTLDALFKKFIEYIAEQGIDTDYYTHGRESCKDKESIWS
jgi:hypothetical protein